MRKSMFWRLIFLHLNHHENSYILLALHPIIIIPPMMNRRLILLKPTHLHKFITSIQYQTLINLGLRVAILFLDCSRYANDEDPRGRSLVTCKPLFYHRILSFLPSPREESDLRETTWLMHRLSRCTCNIFFDFFLTIKICLNCI
jgi:hypothetical protein